MSPSGSDPRNSAYECTYIKEPCPMQASQSFVDSSSRRELGDGEARYARRFSGSLLAPNMRDGCSVKITTSCKNFHDKKAELSELSANACYKGSKPPLAWTVPPVKRPLTRQAPPTPPSKPLCTLGGSIPAEKNLPKTCDNRAGKSNWRQQPEDSHSIGREFLSEAEPSDPNAETQTSSLWKLAPFTRLINTLTRSTVPVERKACSKETVTEQNSCFPLPERSPFAADSHQAVQASLLFHRKQETCPSFSLTLASQQRLIMPESPIARRRETAPRCKVVAQCDIYSGKCVRTSASAATDLPLSRISGSLDSPPELDLVECPSAPEIGECRRVGATHEFLLSQSSVPRQPLGDQLPSTLSDDDMSTCMQPQASTNRLDVTTTETSTEESTVSPSDLSTFDPSDCACPSLLLEKLRQKKAKDLARCLLLSVCLPSKTTSHSDVAFSQFILTPTVATVQRVEICSQAGSPQRNNTRRVAETLKLMRTENQAQKRRLASCLATTETLRQELEEKDKQLKELREKCDKNNERNRSGISPQVKQLSRTHVHVEIEFNACQNTASYQRLLSRGQRILLASSSYTDAETAALESVTEPRLRCCKTPTKHFEIKAEEPNHGTGDKLCDVEKDFPKSISITEDASTSTQEELWFADKTDGVSAVPTKLNEGPCSNNSPLSRNCSQCVDAITAEDDRSQPLNSSTISQDAKEGRKQSTQYGVVLDHEAFEYRNALCRTGAMLRDVLTRWGRSETMSQLEEPLWSLSPRTWSCILDTKKELDIQLPAQEIQRLECEARQTQEQLASLKLDLAAREADRKRDAARMAELERDVAAYKNRIAWTEKALEKERDVSDALRRKAEEAGRKGVKWELRHKLAQRRVAHEESFLIMPTTVLPHCTPTAAVVASTATSAELESLRNERETLMEEVKSNRAALSALCRALDAEKQHAQRLLQQADTAQRRALQRELRHYFQKTSVAIGQKTPPAAEDNEREKSVDVLRRELEMTTCFLEEASEQLHVMRAAAGIRHRNDHLVMKRMFRHGRQLKTPWTRNHRRLRPARLLQHADIKPWTSSRDSTNDVKSLMCCATTLHAVLLPPVEEQPPLKPLKNTLDIASQDQQSCDVSVEASPPLTSALFPDESQILMSPQRQQRCHDEKVCRTTEPCSLQDEANVAEKSTNFSSTVQLNGEHQAVAPSSFKEKFLSDEASSKCCCRRSKVLTLAKLLGSAVSSQQQKNFSTGIGWGCQDDHKHYVTKTNELEQKNTNATSPQNEDVLGASNKELTTRSHFFLDDSEHQTSKALGENAPPFNPMSTQLAKVTHPTDDVSLTSSSGTLQATEGTLGDSASRPILGHTTFVLGTCISTTFVPTSQIPHLPSLKALGVPVDINIKSEATCLPSTPRITSSKQVKTNRGVVKRKQLFDEEPVQTPSQFWSPSSHRSMVATHPVVSHITFSKISHRESLPSQSGSHIPTRLLSNPISRFQQSGRPSLESGDPMTDGTQSRGVRRRVSGTLPFTRVPHSLQRARPSLACSQQQLKRPSTGQQAGAPSPLMNSDSSTGHLTRELSPTRSLIDQETFALPTAASRARNAATQKRINERLLRVMELTNRDSRYTGSSTAVSLHSLSFSERYPNISTQN